MNGTAPARIDLGIAPKRGRTSLLARSTGALALAALTWWAFKPIPNANVEPAVDTHAAPTPTVEPTRLALDLSAFHAPLWVAAPAPPQPPAAPKSEPPPPPLKLQILAIARDGGEDRALLYDPDTDKLLWVRAGQAIGPRTVERVTDQAVVIRDGKHLRTLALREAAPAGSALERALRPGGGLR